MKLWTLLLFTFSSAKASGVQSFLWPPQKCLLEEQEEDVISDPETDFDANGYRRISAPNASEALQAVLSLRLERFYDALDTSRIRKRRVGPNLADLQVYLSDAILDEWLERRLSDGETIRTPRIDSNVLFMHSLGVTKVLDCQERVLSGAVAEVSLLHPGRTTIIKPLSSLHATRLHNPQIQRHKLSKDVQTELIQYMRDEKGEDWRTAAQLSELRKYVELGVSQLRAALESSSTQALNEARRLQNETDSMERLALLELQLTQQRLDDRMARNPAFYADERDLVYAAQAQISAIEHQIALSALDAEFRYQTTRIHEDARRFAEAALLRARAEAALEADFEHEDLELVKQLASKKSEAAREAVQLFFELSSSLLRQTLAEPTLLLRFMLGSAALVALSIVVAEAVQLAFSLWARAAQAPKILRADQQAPKPVVSAQTDHRLSQLLLDLRSRCAARLPLPHLLICGPPGVGKSMLAHYLRSAAALRMVIRDAGDLAPAELEKLLTWAARRRVCVALLTSVEGEVAPTTLDRMDVVLHLTPPARRERQQLATQLVERHLQSTLEMPQLMAKLPALVQKLVDDAGEHATGRQMQSVALALQAKALLGADVL